MRGEWLATELTVNGLSLDLGLDAQGRIDWPVSHGTFDFASLAIDRLNLTGRIALYDAASGSTLELSDIAFSGDVRSLAGSIRGDGNFMLAGDPLSVPDLLRPNPRRQRHPRPSQYRSGRACAGRRHRRRARLRCAGAAV